MIYQKHISLMKLINIVVDAENAQPFFLCRYLLFLLLLLLLPFFTSSYYSLSLNHASSLSLASLLFRGLLRSCTPQRKQ
jgi:hypothetical protein